MLHRLASAPAAAPLITRAEGDRAAHRLSGYASVWWREGDPSTEYRMDLGGVVIVERILRGAFDQAMREGDCRCFWNHREDVVLGRQSAGTLRLTTDSIGLRYEVDLPPTAWGDAIYESVRRADVRSSSFSFNYGDTNLIERDGGDTIILEVITVKDLVDVGPVWAGAYAGASVSVAGQRSRPAPLVPRLALDPERARRANAMRKRARLVTLGL